MSAPTIDTGDHIHHAPTGEDWTVAFVEDGRLVPCGWPMCYANLSDCTLLEKASESDRDSLLRDMAKMGGDDARGRYAVRRIGQQPKAGEP